MSYKDLLVVLDSDRSARVRIDLAAALAERFSAHLVALYPLRRAARKAPSQLGYFDPALLDPFFADLRERAREAADKVRAGVRTRRQPSRLVRRVARDSGRSGGRPGAARPLRRFGYSRPARSRSRRGRPALGRARSRLPSLPDARSWWSPMPVVSTPSAGGSWSDGTLLGKPPARSTTRCRCWRLPRSSPF